MSIQYEQGDMRRWYATCDADGCPNTLRDHKAFAMGPVPSPATGWKTTGKDTDDRQDYCAEHASLA